MLKQCRLTIDEAQTIIDAHRTWMLKEIIEICTMLEQKGIRKYTISRNLHDAFRVALWPNVYMDSKLAEEGKSNIITQGIIFFPKGN